MHRTEGTYHSSNLFQDGPPGTRVEENFLNAVQEEIANVIEAAGITLKTADSETRDQLLAAILSFASAGGFFYATVIKSADYTVTSDDAGKMFLVDATAADVTLTLPAPSDGFAIGVKKTDSSVNKVTLDPAAAAQIEGGVTFDLLLENGSVIAISNGTEYFLVGLNEVTEAMCATPLKNALIKAWVNFDGTGVVSITDSFNVSSITDNGQGDYTVNWDTNFANTNYCFWGSVRDNESIISPASDLFLGTPDGGTKTVGALQIGACAIDGVTWDSDEICVAAIGDQ